MQKIIDHKNKRIHIVGGPGETAVHEAGHFVMYLLCCSRIKVKPVFGEKGMVIGLKGSYVNGREMLPVDALRRMLTDNPTGEAKRDIIRLVVMDIRILLAGIAAAILRYEKPVFWLADKQATAEILTGVYEHHLKTPGSDIPRALERYTMMGGRNDILSLLPHLLHTIHETGLHWNEVMIVARKLEQKKRIRGNELEELVHTITNKLRANDKTNYTPLPSTVKGDRQKQG